MYEKEELKIKQEIYDILYACKKNSDYEEQGIDLYVNLILLLIKDNINILFDMNKHIDK